MVKVRGVACAFTLAVALTGAAAADAGAATPRADGSAPGPESGAVTGGSPARGRPSVRVTPLDGLAGAGADAIVFDINERGVAVGGSQPAGGSRHPVAWDGATPTDLMPDRPAEAAHAHATAINDRGAIAGNDGRGIFGGDAYLWEDGADGPAISLPLDRPGQAVDITNRGLVLYAESVAPAVFAAVGLTWDDGVATRAPALPGSIPPLYGYDVNERGLVVGNEFAFGPLPGTWRPGGPATPLPIPDGELGAVAVAVNERGDVAGVTHPSGRPRAVVRWRDGVPQRLTGPGGEPAGLSAGLEAEGGSLLNRWGDVAGVVTRADGTLQATLWRGSTATVLPAPEGVVSTVATAVNDRRQVVGFGEVDGERRGLLWDGDRVVDLTALAGEAGSLRTVITDINDRGQVVGYVEDRDGPTRAYRWDVR